MKGDSFIAQLIDKVCLPIPLMPGWIDRIERCLQCKVWHWSNKVNDWFLETANWFKYLFSLVQISDITPHDAAHRFSVKMFRKVRRWRHVKKGKKAVEFFRSRRNKLAVPLHHLAGVLKSSCQSIGPA